MTISSTNRKAGPYVGNDTATDFPFDFKVFSASDLLVVRADASGEETILILDTDFTVALNANQDANPGGTVTLLSVLASGFSLVIASDMENLQPAELTNNGGFYPKVINAALDRLTILVQQLDERVRRAVKYGITSSLPEDQALPAPVPYALIGWNATGDGFQNTDPTYSTALASDLASESGATLVGYEGGSVKAALDVRVPEIGTYALLRAYTGLVTAFRVRGVSNLFDGGHGVFRVDAADTTSADDGGTILVDVAGRRWKRVYSDEINLLWFGPDRAGEADSTAIITAAINAAIAAVVRLYVPSGTYVFNGYSRTTSLFDLEIVGDASNRPVFQPTQAAVDAGTVRLFRFEPDATLDVTGFALAATVKPNQRSIVLDTVAGLEVGMLFQISSSEFWYHDPRGEDTKGELHLIESIDAGTKTVRFTDHTRDTYNPGTHTITLRAFRANRFVVKNLHIKMPKPAGATTTIGFQVSQCLEPIFENVKVEGMTAWGALIMKCWKARFANYHAHGLGRANENGYGIQDKGGVGTIVDGLHAWGCRRAVDFHGLSGTNGCVSRDWQVTNFVVNGGGAHYPDTDVSNESYGLGMHGPTENGTFHHGIISDCLFGINVRSRSITIDGVVFKGTMLAAVSASFGTGLTVRNCTVDRHDYPGKLASFADAVAGSGIADFIRFGVSTGSPEAAWTYDLPTVVEHNTCKGLNESFFRWMSDVNAENLRVSGNTIQATPGAAGTFTGYKAASAAVDVYISKSYIEDLQVNLVGGGTYLPYGSTILLGYRAGVADRAISTGPKSYTVRINDDDVAVLRNVVAPGGRIVAGVGADSAGSGLFKLTPANATITNIGTSLPASWVASATGEALTGTTGTDGNVTMGLTASGDLYVENRVGSNRVFRFTILG